MRKSRTILAFYEHDFRIVLDAPWLRHLRNTLNFSSYIVNGALRCKKQNKKKQLIHHKRELTCQPGAKPWSVGIATCRRLAEAVKYLKRPPSQQGKHRFIWWRSAAGSARFRFRPSHRARWSIIRDQRYSTYVSSGTETVLEAES